MHCVNCGTPLPAGVDNCPNCQAATPYNHRKAATQPIPPAPRPASLAEEVPQQDFMPTEQNTFLGQPPSISTRPEPTLRAQEPAYTPEPTMRTNESPFSSEPTLMAQETPANAQPAFMGPDGSEPTQRASEMPFSSEPANWTPTPQQLNASNEATQAVPQAPVNPAYPVPESPYAYHSPTNTSAVTAAYSPQPNYSYAPYTVPPQLPPQGQKNRRSPLMIALVLVVILLLLSAAGLLGYAQVIRPAQIRADATATAQAIATRDAFATATANAQATATENAQLTATAVANATATAQAQATAAANQAILTQATSGSPAVDESLAQNSSSNWAEGTATDGSCLFTGGAYHISIHTRNIFLPCIAFNTSFANFAAQVDMNILKGNDAGLIFRADTNTNHFYIFQVSSDGTFNLAKFVDNTGKNSQVLSDGNDPAITSGTGKVNTISIVARGGSIYLYVNKHYLANVTDHAYASGQFGLFAGDSKDATEASFQNLKVWTF